MIRQGAEERRASSVDPGESLIAANPSPATEAASRSDLSGASESVVASMRPVVEFILAVALAVVLFRTFVAEGYLVSSGSMAPALFGFHKDLDCSSCGMSTAVGVEVSSPPAEIVACPNCGKRGSTPDQPVCPGDRLIVHRGAFQFRGPRRWEPVVFRHPIEAQRPYVKRVVGLPGESVRLIAGDVYINGQIARKSAEEFLGLAMVVHDESYPVRASEEEKSDQGYPRWVTDEKEETGWVRLGPTLAVDRPFDDRVATISYRHRGPDGFEAPVRDDVPYNAGQNHWPRGTWGKPVVDLALDADVTHRSGEGSFEITYKPSREEVFVLRLCPASGDVELTRNTQPVRYASVPPWSGQTRRLLLGMVDQRFLVRLKGAPPFDDFELPADETVRRAPEITSSQPFRVAASRLRLEISRARILRDVTYTSEVGDVSRPTGVANAYQLGETEYFMLGDNSPISNDSRVWSEPAVDERLIVGKPAYVFWPAKIATLNFLGRTFQFAPPNFSRARPVR